MYHDLSVDEEARLKMTDYLKKIVSDFPEKIQGRVETPAAEHLLTVRGNGNKKLLDEDGATEFNHSVAQFLLVTPSVKKYIQTAVAFLTTRMGIPDKDDWRKLRQVLQ